MLKFYLLVSNRQKSNGALGISLEGSFALAEN